MRSLQTFDLTGGLSKMKSNSQKGFTLVELSIVLVIIGLIIGGILKGQELIGNAQVKNVMAQAQSYEAATVSFMDKYNALPGDLQNANTMLSATCTATPCTSGNGDGVVGASVGAAYATSVLTADENISYWQHLSLGRFIGGIVGGGGASSTSTYGSRFPSAVTGGGFQIVYSLPTGRHAVRLAGTLAAPDPASGALRADQALQLDNRLDDGRPVTGTVQTNSTISSDTTCYDPAGSSSYRAALTAQSCNVVFVIR